MEACGPESEGATLNCFVVLEVRMQKRSLTLLCALLMPHLSPHPLKKNPLGFAVQPLFTSLPLLKHIVSIVTNAKWHREQYLAA